MSDYDFSNASTDPFTMGVDQIEDHDDLIYTIVMCPTYEPIKYKPGGAYDRVLKNMQAHSDDELLEDNDKYQWVRVPSPSNLHSVCLVRPDKVPQRRRKEYIADGKQKEWNYWTNVVRLDLFFYYSAAYENIQAFTFGDRQRIIKPLKILKHQWEIKHPKYNAFGHRSISLFGHQTEWTCKKCGLSAASRIGNAKAIFPSRMLTCDEAMVRDIIL